jgi:L-asparaginase/Glu-tRNA(Gln) amidotransferase subunit D
LKTKSKKRRKIKSKAEVQKLDLKNFIEEDEKVKQEDEIDNKSVCSEDSEDMSDENDEDKTFDVDDCESDVDESFDDTGAFSD